MTYILKFIYFTFLSESHFFRHWKWMFTLFLKFILKFSDTGCIVMVCKYTYNPWCKTVYLCNMFYTVTFLYHLIIPIYEWFVWARILNG